MGADIRKHERVALFMGAWIEINVTSFCGRPSRSHSSWVRGLKFKRRKRKLNVSSVALFMGAWIEIPRFVEDRPAITGRTLHGCVD